MQLTQLLDGRSVLDKLFFQNEVQRVLYKLVLVTYPLDHSERIYSPSNFMQAYSKNQKIKLVPKTLKQHDSYITKHKIKLRTF